jgi:DNA invertase Pin-like site-specific DNA recombinase
VKTVNQTNVRSDGPKAVTYLRVESEVRADWQHDLAMQREACRRHAERLGVEIAEEFIDVGASGNDKGHDGLRRLLALVTRRPIEYLIVYDFIYLTRSPADDAATRQHLARAGVTTVLADTVRRPR